jgi:hypothetical protein
MTTLYEEFVSNGPRYLTGSVLWDGSGIATIVDWRWSDDPVIWDQRQENYSHRLQSFEIAVAPIEDKQSWDWYLIPDWAEANFSRG